MSWLEQITISPAFWLTVATLAFTIFVRSIVSIFQLGLNFGKGELIKGQKEFEKQIISDLRDYKDELLKVTMAAAMQTINEKLKNIDSIERTAQEMKATEAKLEVQIKGAMEKVDEVRGMADNLRSLNAKVDRLQYGQDNQDVRRREK
jgi:hypothetical protein